MEQTWETGQRKLALDISIKCEGICRFRVIATDIKPNSKYADRVIEVNNFRKIYISLPQSPDTQK